MISAVNFRIRILLIGMGIIFSSMHFAFAQCMTYPVSLNDRFQNSVAVIEGKVISQTSFWNSNQDFIFTSNIIDVYKVFKGNITTNQIELITEGGQIGNTMIIAEPSLNLNNNEVGVFFVTNTSNVNNFSVFPPTLQFEGYASSQSLILYDLMELNASDLHHSYPDIVTDVYQVLVNLSGQNFVEIIPFSLNFSNNNGPGIPGTMAFPVITTITTPSTAGTFSVITITGNNFGAGPYGGNRALEFRDANNGGAGFIQTPANHIISWSNNNIQAMVPTQAGSGNIRVTNDLNESTISGVTITINYNQSNVSSGGNYFQPDLINDNGTGGYNFAYNNNFNGNAPAVAAFERALQTWRCGTFVNFNQVGTTTTACQALDNNNIVTFDGACALPAGVLGVSYSYYAGCSGGVWYLNENDLKFRTNATGGINWNYGPAPTAGGLFDFESVALHELGHSHQLGHTILPVTVMNYAVGPNTDRRTLTAISETAGGNDIISRSIVNNTCGPSAMVALNGSNCSINAPIANFSGSPTTGCNSLTVTFSDLSSGTPTSWNWNFPGGIPANFVGQNPPPVTYGAPGSYTVTLTVTNASGNDAETKTNFIVVNNCPPPVADFQGNPASICSGDQVFFIDLSSNSPTSWSWSFPGGAPATSTAQNPTVAYPTAGVYNVTLTATNPYGSGPPVTKTSYITVTDCPLAPAANFSATPTTICTGGSVSFTDLSTNTPSSWQWTFPGGTPVTSIVQNPVVTYNTSGTYNVSLTVTNLGGNSSLTLTGYITVNVCGPPVVDFVGWPTTVCAGSSVTFLDQSTNSPTGWSWTFTGGTPAASVAQNPSVNYSTPGTYSVTLQSTNLFGNNSLTKTAYITVAACPSFGSGLIVNDGSLIQVEPGALVTIEGGFINRDNGANTGRIDNWGLITLSGDWTNNSAGNAFINSSPGTTELLGAAQTITGTTTTNFYNLSLTGSGIKTLNINTVTEGTLALNDRELATQSNWMHVTNPSTSAITRAGILNSTPVAGFVSSTGTGRLRWNTNSTGQYIFPLGSSQGTPRFRPIALSPTDNSTNIYATRFVNNDPTIDGFPIVQKDPNLGNINPYWYQKINGISGTTNPDITIYFDNVQDNIAPLPSLLMAQWAYNAPPVQWRSISGVGITGAASPVLSSVTKAAWVSFNTENFNLAPQSIPLPIDLISFTGTCNSDNVQLKWVTASELNNDYFILEKSYDGTDFFELTKVNGSGTTNQLNEYKFTDFPGTYYGELYYRLRQVDYDGSSDVSKIIAVNCHDGSANTSNILMFPNPAHEQLYITIDQPNAGKATIRIVNVLGQVIFKQSQNLVSGFQQFSIDFSNYSPALYNVIVESNDIKISNKVIKQ